MATTLYSARGRRLVERRRDLEMDLELQMTFCLTQLNSGTEVTPPRVLKQNKQTHKQTNNTVKTKQGFGIQILGFFLIDV